MKEILTVMINILPNEVEVIREEITMIFGTSVVKYFTHETSKNFKVSLVPASCTKMLNEIDEMTDKFGVEYYQGLKVIINHNDLVTLTYLVKELKRRSIRVFDLNLREFAF